ncbi:MAG: MMPL family transporter [Candidatus Heimdallarchaeota archaeon]
MNFRRLRSSITSKYRLNLVFWTFAVLIALPLAPRLLDNVEVSFQAPEDTEAAEARAIIEKEFPESQNTNHILLIQMRDNTAVLNDAVAAFTLAFATEVLKSEVLQPYVQAEDILGYFTIIGTELDQAYPELKDQFVSQNGRTSYILIDTADQGDNELAAELFLEMQAIIDQLSFPMLHTVVTGMAAIEHDADEGIRHDMERIDLVTIPLIIIALAILFRNPRLVPVPLLAILITLVISFAIIGLLAENITILSFVPNVMISLGLGIGVDYSLFLLSRFQEERRHGADVPTAIDDMLAHAGHTISVSGLTLAVAFFGLIIFPVAPLSSVGIAITVTVLVSLAVNLTFVPALLRLAGHKLVPSKEESSNREIFASFQGYWRSVARFSSKNAIPILVIVGLIAIPVSIQVLSMNQTQNTSDFVPEGSESAKGLEILREEFSSGLTAPVTIVIQTGAANEAWSEEYFNASHALIGAIVQTDSAGPSAVLSHTWMRGAPIPHSFAMEALALLSLSEAERNTALASYPPALGNDLLLYLSLAPQFVGVSAQSALIQVILEIDPFSEKALEWVKTVRSEIIPMIPGLQGYDVAVGGSTAESKDMVDRTFELFPLMILVILIVIALLVGLMYRSVLVPLRLLATILLTVSFIYGLAVLFFEEHWGELFRASISQNEGLFWMVPVMSFSILIGLGMDYDLFILGRIREEVWKGKPTREAIADALEHTGGIVTGAAAIMVIAFGGLMLSSSMVLVEFGFILALAVAIDATVVRTFLVPAIMSLAERTNWWPAQVPKLQMGEAALQGSQTMQL